jgi:hypothetical protein
MEALLFVSKLAPHSVSTISFFDLFSGQWGNISSLTDHGSRPAQQKRFWSAGKENHEAVNLLFVFLEK